MGSGSWTTKAYSNYVTNTHNLDVNSFSTSTNFSAQDMFVARYIAKELDPLNVMRECRDSDEHPNTLPVILALDVTGSMGDAAVRVAQKLNEIMTDLYADVNLQDIEFCIMGIGDLKYDNAPIQISQFESDVRIAEQLDKIYFESGGGGNTFESYSAAWYMGLNHCKLDCWERGQKGIIITMGDELPNPYLPVNELIRITGDSLQGDIETKDLLVDVKEKYDVYHISIDDKHSSYKHYSTHSNEDGKWRELLGDNYLVASLDNLALTITSIILNRQKNNFSFVYNNLNEVDW